MNFDVEIYTSMPLPFGIWFGSQNLAKASGLARQTGPFMIFFVVYRLSVCLHLIKENSGGAGIVLL